MRPGDGSETLRRPQPGDSRAGRHPGPAKAGAAGRASWTAEPGGVRRPGARRQVRRALRAAGGRGRDAVRWALRRARLPGVGLALTGPPCEVKIGGASISRLP